MSAGQDVSLEDPGNRVKRLAERAGITKRISPYSLRQSFTTAALDAGGPLRVPGE